MHDLYRRYTNEHSRFMPFDGMLLHYRDEGQGSPVLLLHGAFSSLHTFDAWVDQNVDEFRMIRVTLPGFGLTGPPPHGEFGMPFQLEILKSFLDRLNVSKCSIAGSSLGGWIAWEFALKYPEMIDKLILIDAAGFLDRESIPMPFVLARTPFVNRIIRFAVKRSVLEQFLRQVYVDQELVTPDLVNRYYDLFTRDGNTEFFLQMANAHVKDNTLHLREIKAETLVMWGQEDSWLPIRNALRFVEAIPSAKMVLYRNCGHLPMEEMPDKSGRDLAKFLKRGLRGIRTRKHPRITTTEMNLDS